MSTIIDACTKELLAWVLSPSLEVDFVLETVNQLIEKHGISLTAETLIHSDQGSHYTKSPSSVKRTLYTGIGIYGVVQACMGSLGGGRTVYIDRIFC